MLFGFGILLGSFSNLSILGTSWRCHGASQHVLASCLYLHMFCFLLRLPWEGSWGALGALGGSLGGNLGTPEASWAALGGTYPFIDKCVVLFLLLGRALGRRSGTLGGSLGGNLGTLGAFWMRRGASQEND